MVYRCFSTLLQLILFSICIHYTLTSGRVLAQQETLNNQSGVWEWISCPKLINELNGKEFIFYQVGHKGHNWAIICKDDDLQYRFYNGTSRDSTKRYEECPFDTCRLINEHKENLEWAFNNLTNETIITKASTEYNPFYRRVIGINNQGLQKFYIDKWEISYNEENTTESNKRLSSLLYLLFWLSAEEARCLLPDKIPYPKVLE